MPPPATLKELIATLPQSGELVWIGIRPARREALQSLDEVVLDTDVGVDGDRYAGRSGTRQVTLIQHEHIVALASLVGRPVHAGELRRNLVVSGINLLALKNRRFRIGDAVLEHTGACHPCSRMEAALGPGGYNAMRGHGGITARVLYGASIAVGYAVTAEN